MPETIPLIPAPWHLRGSGYILLYKFPRRFVETVQGLPAPLRGTFSGGCGAVVAVDYQQSDAGPYRELLMIPGLFAYGSRKRYAITHIYVSTRASVHNGRANWGIPKEIADFDVQALGKGRTRIRVTRQGRTCVELTMQARGPGFPVTTAIVPARWRTLIQPWQDRTYLTAPRGSGTLVPARLENAHVDDTCFPDFTQGRLVAATLVRTFRLTFPRAKIVNRGQRA